VARSNTSPRIRRWRGDSPRCASGHDRLLRTADFATSRSGNPRTDLAARPLALRLCICFMTRGLHPPRVDHAPADTRLSPGCPLFAPGISIATAKTSVNAGRHRRTYRQEPGHKGALAVRLRKLAIDAEKTLQGVAELEYQQSFLV
jgi:hypothetical protein